MDKPQPIKTESRHHHIYRVDNEIKRIHAWQVDVVRNNHGTYKRFSDAAYGGKREALQSAINYRNDLIAKTNLFDHQIWIRTKLRRNNKSGVPGVYRNEKSDTRYPNAPRLYWVAIWVDELGVRRCRSFSISRYGELEAKRMAIEERERKLIQVCVAKGSHWRDPLIQKARKSKLIT